MREIDIEELGANRGGDAFADGISHLKRGTRIRVVDPEGDRAKRLVDRLKEGGFAAHAEKAHGSPESDARAHYVAVDDPNLVANAAGAPIRSNQVREIALIGSVDTHGSLGGLVIGAESVLTSQSDEVQHNSHLIFQGLSNRAREERQTSQNITNKFLNTNIGAMREEAHKDLGEQCGRFLECREVTPGNWIRDGSTNRKYDVEAVKADPGMLMREMNEFATGKILPTKSVQRAGVVFCADDSMYMVLAKNVNGRWVIERKFEIPPPEVAPTQLPVPRPKAPRRPRLFLTD